ncbi:response regulator transcription factor [Limnobacter sp.]|uniref:response regulator transcription factor n=1 Tax=Limnobacter sp. TaxID=2003368 RepID=UPI0035148FC0
MDDLNRQLLVVDDDPVFSATLLRSLARQGIPAQQASNHEEALRLASRCAFSDVVLDLNLGDHSGLHLIGPLRQMLPSARLLILTGYASIATTVQAIKLGADNYLAKPTTTSAILNALAGSGQATTDSPALSDTPMSVPRLEWEHIQRVLAEHQGNVSATARALNMHRRTLQRKLAKRPVSR